VRYVIGIDIGGTNLVVGAVREDGSGLGTVLSQPTRSEEGPDSVLARLTIIANTVIEETLSKQPEAEVIGVGIGAPGPLDTSSGVVFLTPNLAWVDLPLRQRMADALGYPATLDNDANCAILGEWWQGAARGAQHALGVTIGTGIGGGVITNGALYHGASDCAGELGHTSLDLQGRKCKCGNYGCLEAYASGPAIALRAVEAIEVGEPSVMLEHAGGDTARITAEIVYQAAQAGDNVALEVVRDTARYLGTGIANFVNIFNPEVVVVCGGVTRAGERLFAPLRQEVARRAFKPAVAACRIVAGELPGTAGVYGAAASFLQLRDAGKIGIPAQGMPRA